MILGAETASTFSSRGIYYWPVIYRGQVLVYHPENQSNSYDNENASWSNVPDLDFIMDDDKEWMIGQFVWTGFDYLGEPTPYDTDTWPSHSSVLEYLTWPVFRKTAFTFIEAFGTRKTIPCMFSPIGILKVGKVKRFLFTSIPIIRKLNCLSTV